MNASDAARDRHPDRTATAATTKAATFIFVAWLATLAWPARGVAQTALAPAAVEAIEAVFADIRPDGPGCAAGVLAAGSLAYAAGFGLANLDYGLPITPRSNFYLGSVGKQFTAAAVAHAAGAGHLSLDDPIQKWIPEIPEYDRPVTIRHLIHHTSGLRDYLVLWNLAGHRLEDVHDDDDVLGLIARQRNPNFSAGEQYLYSNTGYFLLGVIIERATGRSLRAYVEDALLEPLGMTRTRVHDDRRDVLPDRVVGYEMEAGEARLNHPWNFDKVGSGGVYSSIEELAHWDRNYYTEEVGGPGFTERLRERGVLNDGSTLPYAFGLSHGEYRGLQTIGHGGSLAGFRSELLRFPGERTTIVVLCNFPSSDPGERARKIADAVLADRLAPADAVAGEPDTDTPVLSGPDRLSAEQLDAFTGHWRASMGIEVEIRRDGDRLYFLQNGSRSPLVVAADGILRLEAADIEMTFSDLRRGKYHAQTVVQRGQPFTAARFDPAAEAAGRGHAPLAGEYDSEELDATYRLYESEGGLVLEMPGGRRLPARLVDDDRLRAGSFTLRLERRGGDVVGFVLDAGRVRGLRFVRSGES